MSKKNRIRLFIDSPLSNGAQFAVTDAQRHYLLNVMRLAVNDEVYVFNGKDGEYRCKISVINKKECQLEAVSLFQPYFSSPDVWLLFAPLKKDNTDLIVVKSVELGVAKIVPVRTDYTSSGHLRIDRLQQLAIEAAEQSRRQDVPIIADENSLESLLKNWPQTRRLIYLDETGASGTVVEQMPKCVAPAALLIGPEGGFSQKELEFLQSLPYTQGVSLGRRILRAETAAIAALACWQAWCGDWNNKGEQV